LEATKRQEKSRAGSKYAVRQAAIIAVATRMINRRGVIGMTLAQVASELDMTPTAIAYYFKTKDDLAAASFLAGMSRLLDIIGEGVEGSPAERIMGLIDRYFRYLARMDLGSEAELIAPNDIRALNRPEVLDAYADVFRAVRTQISDPLPVSVNHQSVNARAHLLLAQLHWFAAWRQNLFPSDYARSGQRVSDVLLKGIVSSTFQIDRQWFSRPVRAREPGEEKAKDAFLQAATELINEQGYHGASVDRIAARLSVSKGSFYHHLETKDALIAACFERTIDILQATIVDIEHRSSSGLHALALLAATLVHRQLSGEATLLRISATSTLPEALQPRVLMDYHRIAVRIAAIFSDGMVDGSIRPLDSFVAAEVFLGMINTSDELRYFVRDLDFSVAIKYYIEPFFIGIV